MKICDKCKKELNAFSECSVEIYSTIVTLQNQGLLSYDLCTSCCNELKDIVTTFVKDELK